MNIEKYTIFLTEMACMSKSHIQCIYMCTYVCTCIEKRRILTAIINAIKNLETLETYSIMVIVVCYKSVLSIHVWQVNLQCSMHYSSLEVK